VRFVWHTCRDPERAGRLDSNAHQPHTGCDMYLVGEQAVAGSMAPSLGWIQVHSFPARTESRPPLFAVSVLTRRASQTTSILLLFEKQCEQVRRGALTISGDGTAGSNLSVESHLKNDPSSMVRFVTSNWEMVLQCRANKDNTSQRDGTSRGWVSLSDGLDSCSPAASRQNRIP